MPSTHTRHHQVSTIQKRPPKWHLARVRSRKKNTIPSPSLLMLNRLEGTLHFTGLATKAIIESYGFYLNTIATCQTLTCMEITLSIKQLLLARLRCWNASCKEVWMWMLEMRDFILQWSLRPILRPKSFWTKQWKPNIANLVSLSLISRIFVTYAQRVTNSIARTAVLFLMNMKPGKVKRKRDSFAEASTLTLKSKCMKRTCKLPYHLMISTPWTKL